MAIALSRPTSRGSRWVPPAPGHQAELDFRQTEPGTRRRDPEMAAERNFETAAERGTVQRRHHRLRHGVDGLDDVDSGGGYRRLVEFGDVGAGDERASRRCDHYGFDRSIFARTL